MIDFGTRAFLFRKNPNSHTLLTLLMFDAKQSATISTSSIVVPTNSKTPLSPSNLTSLDPNRLNTPESYKYISAFARFIPTLSTAFETIPSTDPAVGLRSNAPVGTPWTWGRSIHHDG
jgi:hypothetical protein